MKIVRVFIPGRYEDGFIYMGRLIILTENHAVRVCNLDRLVLLLESQLHNVVPVPTLMFSRNDWLASAQFKSTMRNPEVRQAVLKAFDSFPQPYAEVNEHVFEDEQDIKLSANVLLDMMIYNSRLYIGADSGLYRFDVEWESNGTAIVDPKAVKKIDARCLNISAKSGAVNASCGDGGLFTWLGESDRNYLSNDNQINKIAERSIKTSWLQYDFVNYARYNDPVLYRNEHEKAVGNVERETTIITKVGTDHFSIDYLLPYIGDDSVFSKNDIQYVYNSNRTFVVQTLKGDIYTIGITDNEIERPKLSYTRAFSGMSNRILSANFSKPGLIVETDHEVQILSQKEWTSIVDTEVLSVRVFVRSKRYQNIIAITQEEGILLVGLFDETELQASK